MKAVKKVKKLFTNHKDNVLLGKMLKIKGNEVTNSDTRTEVISKLNHSKSSDNVIRKSNFITKNYGQSK